MASPVTASEHVERIPSAGYTIVEDAIAPELVDRLLAAIDALHAELSVTPAANIFEGLHTLRVVAIDGAGAAGPVRDLALCVTPPVPDNLNACDPKSNPPAAVLSLSWDTAVDLDLVVVAPDGRIVDAKHPRTVAPPPPGPSTGGDAGALASAGVFDRDSNGGCVIDGVQREDLVFQTRPAPGSYLVYASLFDACGKSSVHFRFSLYEATAAAADPKLQQLAESITKQGVLLPIEASGGARLGTFVTEVTF